MVVKIFGKNIEPNNNGVIYVGTDPEMKPGKYRACLSDGYVNWYCDDIEVTKKNFPERKALDLTGRWAKIKSVSRVEENQRVNDGVRIQAAYLKGNQYADYIDSEFISPLDYIDIDNFDDILVTDSFGFRIYSNGRTLHRGVDFRTRDFNDQGFYKRPVRAANSGKIVLADGGFLFEGNLIIIDHGSGIFSLYMHLDSFTVKERDLVKAGQQIGVSGETGRVSGPHLHFAVKVNGIFVEPLEFIKTMNSR